MNDATLTFDFEATPAKLRDGSYGARVVMYCGGPRRGDAVKVTTRSGKSWVAIVTEVVSRRRGSGFIDTTIVRTVRVDSPEARQARLDGIVLTGEECKKHSPSDTDQLEALRAEWLRVRNGGSLL